MDKIIDKVISTPLKVINNEKGNILHAMKSTDNGFDGFGEAYFSEIKFNETKGWKKHTKMTLNFIVPLGEVQVNIKENFDEMPSSYIIGESNYARLTIPPGLWVSFKGLSNHKSLILNIANIEHDPEESENIEII
ncbi:WxcM-like domain-containing protein [Gammaproteobacteria bacterium]|nr:WxcM-like domain-containing protein [Gammaproteobacteria bacterium]